MDLNINRIVASNTSIRNNTNVKTTGESGGKVIDAVYDNSSGMGVSVDDFLQLMIAQLKNQDFMNPMEDTAYVTQLAQFATMQQMQELAYYSKINYVVSLVGKEVTAAKLSVGGNVEKVTGEVEKVSLVNNEYTVYVKGKPYALSQIMQVHQAAEPPQQTIVPETEQKPAEELKEDELKPESIAEDAATVEDAESAAVDQTGDSPEEPAEEKSED